MMNCKKGEILMACPACRTMLAGRCEQCGRNKMRDGTELNENDQGVSPFIVKLGWETSWAQ